MNRSQTCAVIKISSQLFGDSRRQSIDSGIPTIVFKAVKEKAKGVRLVFVVGYESKIIGGNELFGQTAKNALAPLVSPDQRNHKALELLHRAANMHCQVDALNALVLAAREHEVEIVPIYVTRLDWADQRRYERLRDIFLAIWAGGAIPAVFANELFVSDEFDWDHDQLACLTAVAIQADEAIFVCAEGEMIEPTTNRDYCSLGSISDMDSIEVPKAPGIVAKVSAARLLSGFGIEMLLGTGNCERTNDSLFVEGKAAVTRVRSLGHRLGHMKGWIALAASSKGELEVSTFLADNLRNGRAVSILTIGVENVRGIFVEGDIVTIVDAGGSILGRGRCRLSADRLRKLMGALGRPDISINSRSEIVIHCDYFVLNPELSKKRPH